MAFDLEEQVRTIGGIDYVVCGGRHVQDFIRFPLIKTIDPVPNYELSSDTIKRNARIGDISGVCTNKFDKVWIIGDPEFQPPLGDSDIAIGIHSAVFSPHVTHAFVSDPGGYLLPRLRACKSPPIGMLDIMTHYVLADQWHRKFIAGIWKNPSPKWDFIREAALNICTEIYGSDSCAGAMHLAWLTMGCKEFVLVSADLTMESYRPGSTKLPCGRYIYEAWAWSLDMIDALVHVFYRNGIMVSCMDKTMRAPPNTEIAPT